MTEISTGHTPNEAPDAVNAEDHRASGKRRLMHVLAGLAVAALPMLAVPAAANAATPCSGQVCLYDTSGAFIGAYQDVTSTWQYFSRDRTASAFDGFSDNAVYFRYSSGKTSCIQPQREASVYQDGYGSVVALMVVSNGNCYPGGKIVT
jgi:hypothetical protein